MKARLTMAQSTPQQAEEPPYRLAKTLASLSLTSRRMRSSKLRVRGSVIGL